MKKLILSRAALLAFAGANAQNTYSWPSTGLIGATAPVSALALGGTGNANPNTGPEVDYAGENPTFLSQSIYMGIRAGRHQDGAAQ